MTTSAQVRTNWDTYVFQNADILAITEKAFPYEVTEESEKEVADAYDSTNINFFEYVVSLTETNVNQISGSSLSRQQRFLVEVRYTKYAGTDGAAFNEVTDALETLLDTVRDDLGQTWQGLIDFVENPISIEPPRAARFNETDCFRAVARFSALKQI